MFVLTNALKSISRSKGRNILIGIIVFIIAASSCVALSIRNSAREAEKAGAELLNITATISLNTRMGISIGGGRMPSQTGGNNDFAQYRSLTLDEMLAYADSDYLKAFYYTASTSLDATGDLEAFTTDDGSSDDSENAFSFPGGGAGRPTIISIGGMGGMTIGDFSVTGYSAEEAMTKFIDGTAKITDGEMFDITAADMTCLISDELAAYNGLSVGDTITLANPNNEEETYTLTVIGIYTDSSAADSGGFFMISTANDPANLICVSYASFLKIMNNSADNAVITTDENGNESSTALGSQTSGTYVFADKENYEAFGKELTEKGLPEQYSLVSTDVESYESSLVPLQQISEYAFTLLVVVLAIGAVILIVINIFNIRERKYEVGVLTAIGIKKSKVALQFVAELLCITLFAIIIGAGTGAAASVPVSNMLLENQIAQMNASQQSRSQNFNRQNGSGNASSGMGPSFSIGGGNMLDMFANPQNTNYLDKINATINLTILLQLIAIGIVLTLISSLAAVIFVMRYEPLKILSNRS